MVEGRYKDRPYLKHPLTEEMLNTTVMLVDGTLVYGTRNVINKLRKEMLPKARQLGGKDLKTRDFIDAFKIRGPSYGDVVRQVMRELQSQGKVRIRNVGTRDRPQIRI